MRTRSVLIAVGAAGLTVAGCNGREETTVVYQALPVVQRDIVLSAQAAGVIEPDTTVEVKSKASGEILEIRVETGELVERGTLMVRIDQRTPRNNLAQAEAELEVAKAQLTNALAQKRRADELFQSQSITETEHEKADLDYANAKATVVRAEVRSRTRASGWMTPTFGRPSRAPSSKRTWNAARSSPRPPPTWVEGRCYCRWPT